MLISGKTKISELIKNNIASIDAIAGINKHFEKLKNPIIRKVMASRISIADAARIGGCSINDFFTVLAPLGFEAIAVKEKVQPVKANDKLRPVFVSTLKKEKTTVLDVRPFLASGQDPFKKIMDTISTMPKDNVLLLINTFEPTPLIKILQKKGFEYYTEKMENDIFHIYFKFSSGIGGADISDLEKTDEGLNDDFSEVMDRCSWKMKIVDVRDLEMPLPMITILAELEKLPDGYALFVHHKKTPQFLFPELIEKGFKYVFKEVPDGGVKLIIYK